MGACNLLYLACATQITWTEINNNVTVMAQGYRTLIKKT